MVDQIWSTLKSNFVQGEPELVQGGPDLVQSWPKMVQGVQFIVKNKFFDFLNVYNELGKVTKSDTSRTVFLCRNGRLKKVPADYAPTLPH